ncbi:MAG TPA: MBL fold metallo-hydrolase [archaeon]|jgi:putative mRNA 3-end processing factor|nr:MBL fold metallo-hydrolase [archaeon]
MSEITVLGGGREVGRLSVLLDAGAEKFLLDHGIEVQNFGIPLRHSVPIDAVLLSHAQLDHSGFVPGLYKAGFRGPTLATPATFDLCELLLRDSLKVQDRNNVEPLYLAEHIKEMEKFRKEVNFGHRERIGSSVVEVVSSGHVPGSVSHIINSAGKRVMFTGDINFVDTQLMKAAPMEYENIDVVITEATYSYKNHPERSAVEDRLREIAQETIYNNGALLLPTFAVGRTQELLLILYDMGFDIYLDGMGIKATEIVMSYPESVKGPERLKKAFGKAHKITRSSQREALLSKPCIIITTAGMMNGGPIGYYMKKLHKRENCSLAITGYMVEGTVGRKLLDTGRYVNEGLDIKPKMRVEQLDFSAHTDHDHLIDFFRKTNPGKIILVHGDKNPEFAGELKGMGFDAFAPANGDKIKV